MEKPDLHAIYASIEEVRQGLSRLDEHVEAASQAALGVEVAPEEWDDSGDDYEPFELMKAKIGEARNALDRAKTELAYVEGMRSLRGVGLAS